MEKLEGLWKQEKCGFYGCHQPRGGNILSPGSPRHARTYDDCDGALKPSGHKAPVPGQGQPPTLSPSTSRRGGSSSFVPPDPHYQQPQVPGKVPIPRLRQESDARSGSSTTGGEKSRVSHACESCRTRKTKCTGDKPSCKACVEHDLPCVYADGKRDKIRKQVGTMAEKLSDLETILRDLSLKVGEVDRERIQQALAQSIIIDEDPEDDCKSSAPSGSKSTPSSSGRPKRPGIAPLGEETVSARVGSTGEIDTVNEDLNRNIESQTTGYYGDSSDLSWMQRLKSQHLNPDVSNTDASSVTDGEENRTLDLVPLTTSSYHCDDIDVETSPGLGEVDFLGVPPQPFANRLLDYYVRNVHCEFPIVGSEEMSKHYLAFINQDPQLSNEWRSKLNLILAIGAKYAQLVKDYNTVQIYDHLVYFARARASGVGAGDLLRHPTVDQVHITGLMAFYLLVTHQINRSWSTSGSAVRQAVSLGMNLRNEASGMTEVAKELRYRTWWALCSLERLLGIMTGRDGYCMDADHSTPPPLPIEERQLSSPSVTQNMYSLRRWYGWSPPSNVSTPESTQSRLLKLEKPPEVPISGAMFFSERSKLGVIISDVLRSLYRSNSVRGTWSEVLQSISRLNGQLELWRSRLPFAFNFSDDQVEVEGKEWLRQRLSLGISYYSATMLVNRPCLCRADRRIPNESGMARESARLYATNCLHAALNLLKLIPTKISNSAELYAIMPWSYFLHHLMQASAVLLLELSFRARHAPTEVDEIFTSAKRALGILRLMSQDDIATGRAYVLSEQLLRDVAPRIGRNVRDLDLPGIGPRRISDNHPRQHQLLYQMAQQDFSYGQPRIYSSFDENLAYGDVGSQVGLQGFPESDQMDAMMDGDPNPYLGYQ